MPCAGLALLAHAPAPQTAANSGYWSPNKMHVQAPSQSSVIGMTTSQPRAGETVLQLQIRNAQKYTNHPLLQQIWQEMTTASCTAPYLRAAALGAAQNQNWNAAASAAPACRPDSVLGHPMSAIMRG